MKIDDGWRKAGVVLVGMVCYTVLKVQGLADAESMAVLGGLISSYLGINLVQYRRQRLPPH